MFYLMHRSVHIVWLYLGSALGQYTRRSVVGLHLHLAVLTSYDSKMFWNRTWSSAQWRVLSKTSIMII